MDSTLGIIDLYLSPFSLDVLTDARSLAAVPFGGKYRIIDFTLSNMVNSGIYNIGIIMGGESAFLCNHFGTGKEWNLDRKRKGLFVLPSAKNDIFISEVGDISRFYQHFDYIKAIKAKNVIISATHIICNIDYNPALERHKETDADITIIYHHMKDDERLVPGSVMVTIDSDNRVKDFVINPIENTQSRDLYMRMCIIKKDVLLNMIDYAFSHHGGKLLRQFQNRVDELKIYAHKFDGYVANIVNVEEYFNHSMEILKEETWLDLFFANGHIYTKVKDSIPTKYMKHANVTNSLLANNCRINGTVENSILFRCVRVDKGAVVKNSILLTNTHVGEGAVLDSVICDKNVKINSNHSLQGDKKYPLVVKKGTVI